MPAAREVDATREARQRRGRRYYRPDRLGRPCVVCKDRLPLLLAVAGEQSHPTCDPSWHELVRIAARAS